jgi:hypothetical protein
MVNCEELGLLSGIELRYGLDDRGFESRYRLGIFSSLPRPDRLYPPPPPASYPAGTRSSLPGGKATGA